MVDRKKVTDSSGTIDLCMTFSTLGFKLRQEETGIVYGKECIDTIEEYDENNKPYSRFTYTETDEKDEEEPSPEPVDTDTVQKAEAWDELTGGVSGE